MQVISNMILISTSTNTAVLLVGEGEGVELAGSCRVSMAWDLDNNNLVVSL